MEQRHRAIATALITVIGLLISLSVIVKSPVPQQRLASTGTVQYRINPNHADVHTLCLLPRIGPGIAQRLVDDREVNGPFDDAADLTRVPMIGDKTAAALGPWTRFDH